MQELQDPLRYPPYHITDVSGFNCLLHSFFYENGDPQTVPSCVASLRNIPGTYDEKKARVANKLKIDVSELPKTGDIGDDLRLYFFNIAQKYNISDYKYNKSDFLTDTEISLLAEISGRKIVVFNTSASTWELNTGVKKSDTPPPIYYADESVVDHKSSLNKKIASIKVKYQGKTKDELKALISDNKISQDEKNIVENYLIYGMKFADLNAVKHEFVLPQFKTEDWKNAILIKTDGTTHFERINEDEFFKQLQPYLDGEQYPKKAEPKQLTQAQQAQMENMKQQIQQQLQPQQQQPQQQQLPKPPLLSGQNSKPKHPPVLSIEQLFQKNNNNNVLKLFRKYDENDFHNNPHTVILFGDNLDFFSNNPGGGTGQKDPASDSQRTNAYGVVTTFDFLENKKLSDEQFYRLMDLQFRFLENFVRAGGRVVIPYNNDGSTMGIGSASNRGISPKGVDYIRQKSAELVNIGATVKTKLNPQKEAELMKKFNRYNEDFRRIYRNCHKQDNDLINSLNDQNSSFIKRSNALLEEMSVDFGVQQSSSNSHPSPSSQPPPQQQQPQQQPQPAPKSDQYLIDIGKLKTSKATVLNPGGTVNGSGYCLISAMVAGILNGDQGAARTWVNNINKLLSSQGQYKDSVKNCGYQISTFEELKNSLTTGGGRAFKLVTTIYDIFLRNWYQTLLRTAKDDQADTNIWENYAISSDTFEDFYSYIQNNLHQAIQPLIYPHLNGDGMQVPDKDDPTLKTLFPNHNFTIVGDTGSGQKIGSKTGNNIIIYNQNNHFDLMKHNSNKQQPPPQQQLPKPPPLSQQNKKPQQQQQNFPIQPKNGKHTSGSGNNCLLHSMLWRDGDGYDVNVSRNIDILPIAVIETRLNLNQGTLGQFTGETNCAKIRQFLTEAILNPERDLNQKCQEYIANFNNVQNVNDWQGSVLEALQPDSMLEEHHFALLGMTMQNQNFLMYRNGAFSAITNGVHEDLTGTNQTQLQYFGSGGAFENAICISNDGAHFQVIENPIIAAEKNKKQKPYIPKLQIKENSPPQDNEDDRRSILNHDGNESDYSEEDGPDQDPNQDNEDDRRSILNHDGNESDYSEEDGPDQDPNQDNEDDRRSILSHDGNESDSETELLDQNKIPRRRIKKTTDPKDSKKDIDKKDDKKPDADKIEPENIKIVKAEPKKDDTKQESRWYNKLATAGSFITAPLFSLLNGGYKVLKFIANNEHVRKIAELVFPVASFFYKMFDNEDAVKKIADKKYQELQSKNKDKTPFSLPDLLSGGGMGGGMDNSSDGVSTDSQERLVPASNLNNKQDIEKKMPALNLNNKDNPEPKIQPSTQNNDILPENNPNKVNTQRRYSHVENLQASRRNSIASEKINPQTRISAH